MKLTTHLTTFTRAALVALLAPVAAAQVVQLPSHERLFVIQGGDTPGVNVHAPVRSQAFGVDFGVVGGNAGRELARAERTTLADFYCFGTPVLAPASGTTVVALDSLPDNALGTHDVANPLGNHVIIRSAGLFLYIAHLQRGSVRVSAGSTVAAGDVIGACGNSGNSDYPHIHVHATGSARFGEGFGVNLRYGPMNVDLAGEHFTGVTWPLIRGLWLTAP